MARSLEDIIRDTLGNQLLQIAQLQAANEALREENAALKVRPIASPSEAPG